MNAYVWMCIWVCMNVYGCLELVGGINVPSIPLGSVRGSYISTPTSLIILYFSYLFLTEDISRSNKLTYF